MCSLLGARGFSYDGLIHIDPSEVDRPGFDSLLAHETTHAVQQGRFGASPRVSDAAPFELEARRAEALFATGRPLPRRGTRRRRRR